jgi:hypothetical protein
LRAREQQRGRRALIELRHGDRVLALHAELFARGHEHAQRTLRLRGGRDGECERNELRRRVTHVLAVVDDEQRQRRRRRGRRRQRLREARRGFVGLFDVDEAHIERSCQRCVRAVEGAGVRQIAEGAAPVALELRRDGRRQRRLAHPGRARKRDDAGRRERGARSIELSLATDERVHAAIVHRALAAGVVAE